MDIAMQWHAVSVNFVETQPRLHLRLARLNLKGDFFIGISVFCLNHARARRKTQRLWRVLGLFSGHYLNRFYRQLPPLLRDSFAFEDAAGVYTENGETRLFAVCTRHAETAELRVLSAGEA